MIGKKQLKPTVFSAPIYIAEQVDQLEPGVITGTGHLIGDNLWKAFSYSERRVLERYIEELVIENLVPLERAGFRGEGQNLYRRIAS